MSGDYAAGDLVPVWGASLGSRGTVHLSRLGVELRLNGGTVTEEATDG